MKISNIYLEIQTIIARLIKGRILLSIALLCGLFLFMGTYTTADATTITINQIIRGVAAMADVVWNQQDFGDSNTQMGAWSAAFSATAEYFDGQAHPSYGAWASANASQTSNIAFGPDGSLMVTDQGSAYSNMILLNLPDDWGQSGSRSSLLVSFSIDGPATFDLHNSIFSRMNSQVIDWVGLDAYLVKDDMSYVLNFSHFDFYNRNAVPLTAGDYTLTYWILPRVGESIESYDFTFDVHPVQGGSIPVPEPSSMMLLGAGLLGLAGAGNGNRKPR